MAIYGAGAQNVSPPLTGAELVDIDNGGAVKARTTTAAIAALGADGAALTRTTITTVGNGVLTAPAIAGQLITRTGPTGAFTDTTAAAAAIIAAAPGVGVGSSFEVTIQNATAFAQTLAAGAGVSMSTVNVVPAQSVATYLVTRNAAAAITFSHVATVPFIPIPASQFTTAALAVGVLAAGAITGAAMVYLQNTGATPGAQTTRTAAQMLADFPAARVGLSFSFRLINTGAGTLTLTADASVTLTGTATVLTNTFRDYILTFLTPTTASIQSVGSGVSP